MDLTNHKSTHTIKEEDSNHRVRKPSLNRRQSTGGSATSPIVARFALLVSSMSPELQQALATLVTEITIAQETQWGSVTIRFKGNKVFIDTNRKHLIK